ncbi:regulatory protein RecX [Segeticoccus rhizosphaerae]|uniref:regulatory protein RecX n=1 Tax=Segeticoccus rhizosphaerae TaxID=1104777 RepID=UPI001EF07CF0|nr:regulatory protein RecX [Segeticoccus rhizosphaerae]
MFGSPDSSALGPPGADDRRERVRSLADMIARVGLQPSGGGGASTSSGRTPPPEDPATRGADADPYAVARQIVLRQLTMAPRSRAQLEDKLRQKNCDPEVAREVLDRLTEVGLVDDEAYAAMLVRSQQSGRGLARRALARELSRKGVDRDVADQALEQVGAEDERDRARRLVDKKLRTMHGLDRQVQTRRLAGMLARKGYSSSMAFAVIREALDELPQHRRD